MARNFLSEIDGSYPIPGSICVMSGNDSLDIRDWCDTVADFETAATGGFELRRDGLITYEKSTQKLKLCKASGDTFTWVEIGKGTEVVNDLTTGGTDKALSAEQGKTIKSQLDENISILDQEDFVESISKQMYIKNMLILCNNKDTNNYSIFYELPNKKAIGYHISNQVNDDYSIFKGGRFGDLTETYTIASTLKHTSKEGTFNEDYAPNGFTIEVGSKLIWKNVTNVNGIDFYSYTDNRGGIWKCTLTDGTDTKTVNISTFKEQNGYILQNLFSDLDQTKIYSVVYEFMGDDPINPPSSGQSRGWYIMDTSQSIVYQSLVLKNKVITIDNTSQKFPLQSESNKDFAFLLKKKDAQYKEQFFPLHEVKTSYKIQDLQILADGVDVSASLVNSKSLYFKNNIMIIQKVQCKIPDDIENVLGVMTSKYIFRNDGVVELLNSFKVNQDIFIKDGYVNMFPVDNRYCPVLKTSLMNMYDLTKTSGSTNLIENDKAISYIAGGGDDGLCAAMTTINPLSTLRKNKIDRRKPLMWIEHRTSTFQKLYPHVFTNANVSAGEIYSFGCKFIVGKIDEFNSLYMGL